MASLASAADRSSYSDKQVASSSDYDKEVVTATSQPYPDAYAYANPNNSNNDSTHGGSGGGGLEAVHHLLSDAQENSAWAERKPRRKICGLSSRSFIIVVAVATALLVAAIIGGSIGGVLANKNNSASEKAEPAQPGSTSSTSAISTAAPTAATTSASATTATSETATSRTTPFSSSSLSTETTGTSVLTASVLTASVLTASVASTAVAKASLVQEGSYNCPADNNEEYVSSSDTSETWTILCDTDWPEGVAALSGGTVSDLDTVIAYSVRSCIDQCVENNLAGGGCQAVVYGANITLALSRAGIDGNCFLKNDRGAQNTADNSGQVEAAYLSSSSA